MSIQVEPISFFKSLSDNIRLSILLLLQAEEELCVCELCEALDEIQPKISRNLALLKKVGLVVNRRQGQWIYYSINKQLPQWATQVLLATYTGNGELIAEPLAKLNQLGANKERLMILCKNGTP